MWQWQWLKHCGIVSVKKGPDSKSQFHINAVIIHQHDFQACMYFIFYKRSVLFLHLWVDFLKHKFSIDYMFVSCNIYVIIQSVHKICDTKACRRHKCADRFIWYKYRLLTVITKASMGLYCNGQLQRPLNIPSSCNKFIKNVYL